MENNKSSLKFLWEVSGRIKINIAVLTLLQTAMGSLGVYNALLLKNLINAAAGGSREDFAAAALIFAVLMLLQLLLWAADRYLSEYTQICLENRFKGRLFCALIERDFGEVMRIHSGEWQSRLTSDTAVAASGLTTVIPGAVGMAVRLVGAVIMIMRLEPILMWVIIPVGAAAAVISAALRKKSKQLYRHSRQKDGEVRSFVQDILHSMIVVRAYSAQSEAAEKLDSKMTEHKKARMKQAAFSAFCGTGFSFVMNGAYAAGAIFCAARIMTGSMSFGTLMAILQLVGQIQAPFAGISGYLSRWYSTLAGAERLMEAESFPDTCEERTDAAGADEFYRNEFCGFGLDKVSFTYPAIGGEERPPAIEDISLFVKKGEYVAFIGPSGCGKSTAMKLFLSLYSPDSGECYIRTQLVRHRPSGELRQLFAYIPQGNHLMSGSIREIVTLGSAERRHDDDEIFKALWTACADEFISELPDGIDTVLGEQGAGLSEGQLQRIAVARAIFSARPILLLDEATSALDEQTEEKMLCRLKEQTDKTVVIVTHRPAALRICDRVYNFTDGGELHVQ